MNLSKRKLISVVFALLVSAIVCLMFGNESFVYAQANEKIVEIGNEFEPPVEIIAVKNQKGVIRANEYFQDDETWLKGLSVRIRNIGKKSISFISIGVRFPRPATQPHKLDFVENLDYGKNPFPCSRNEDASHSLEPTLLPDEEINMGFSDLRFANTKKTLSEAEYPIDISKIKVYVSMLAFTDGSIWKAGGYYFFDEKDPNRLVPQKKKVNQSFRIC